MFRPRSFLALLPLAFATLLCAQGAGTVLEPFFPPSCGSIDAQIQSSNGVVAAKEQQPLDTARIQKAINRCGKGRALMLRVNAERNAFISGPLILRPDITIILGRGVTLFAANDPRQFDVSPGSCGMLNGIPSGCKPLISVDHATGDGIMGDGVIDGRGVAAPVVSVDNSDNFTLYRITLRNAAGLTLTFDHGNGLTLWGVHLKAADTANSKLGGMAIGSEARNVAITRSYTDSGAGETEIPTSDSAPSAQQFRSRLISQSAELTDPATDPFRVRLTRHECCRADRQRQPHRTASDRVRDGAELCRAAIQFRESHCAEDDETPP